MKVMNVVLKVVGVSFSNPDGTNRQLIIGSMTQDHPVFLVREKDNKFDPNAIAVHTISGQIGYIGKDYAAILANMMDNGHRFKASVFEVGTYKNTNYIQITIDEV